MSPDSPLTLALCVYNGQAHIKQSIDSLLSQTEQCPIIIVDDGSTDETATILNTFASHPAISIITHDRNKGLSSARNTALAACATDWIAYTDDDVEVPVTWTESLIKAWRTTPSSTKAIGGPVVPAPPENLTQRYLAADNPLVPLEIDFASKPSPLRRLALYYASPPTSSPRPVYSLVGANISFDVATIRLLGGFNHDIAFGGDEEYLCDALIANFGPKSVVFDQSVTVTHVFDHSFAAALKRESAYGAGAGRRWRTNGGIPSLRPTICATVLITTLLLPRHPRLAVFALFAVPYTLRRHLLHDLAFNNPTPALYPAIALLAESANVYGFIKAVLTRKK